LLGSVVPVGVDDASVVKAKGIDLDITTALATAATGAAVAPIRIRIEHHGYRTLPPSRATATAAAAAVAPVAVFTGLGIGRRIASLAILTVRATFGAVRAVRGITVLHGIASQARPPVRADAAAVATSASRTGVCYDPIGQDRERTTNSDRVTASIKRCSRLNGQVLVVHVLP